MVYTYTRTPVYHCHTHLEKVLKKVVQYVSSLRIKHYQIKESRTYIANTVEPPNKGHIGTRSFVLYREVSFIQRLKCTGIIGIGTCGFVLEVFFIRCFLYLRFHCRSSLHSSFNIAYLLIRITTDKTHSSNCCKVQNNIAHLPLLNPLYWYEATSHNLHHRVKNNYTKGFAGLALTVTYNG